MRSIFLINLFESIHRPILYHFILFLQFMRSSPIYNRLIFILFSICIQLYYFLLWRQNFRIIALTFAYFFRILLFVIFLFNNLHLLMDFAPSKIINLQLNFMRIITINQVTLSRLCQTYKALFLIKMFLIIYGWHSAFSIIKYHLFIAFTLKSQIFLLHYLTKPMIKWFHQQQQVPNHNKYKQETCDKLRNELFQHFFDYLQGNSKISC